MLSLVDFIWRQFCKIAKMPAFLKLDSESEVREMLEDELVTAVNKVESPLFPNAFCIQ